MHEILTLQFGQQANFLSTHFWNTQESYQTGEASDEINHDILFRQGIGADGGETYLPRTVIYDLKGGFGSLRQINELYEIQHGEKGGDVWYVPGFHLSFAFSAAFGATFVRLFMASLEFISCSRTE